MEGLQEECKPQESGSSSESGSSDTPNPVLKQIAKLNGQINRMSIQALQENLKSYQLDPRGKKDVLKKRLKSYYKRKQLSTANIRDPNGINHFYKYLVIIDFEATCDVGQSSTYRQEIIEFPAVLLSTKEKCIVDEFHSYVRPIINPKLTRFCTSLTGITQDVVNRAPHFIKVLSQFENWLIKHNLSTSANNFTVVADGPWDMGRFLVEQCKISEISLPDWGRKWINVRKTYSNFYDTKRICLRDMLGRLGMKFEGQPHSGIDDSRNITRIVVMLMEDGANLRINERIKEKADTSLSVVNVSRKEFEDSHDGHGRRSSRRDRKPSRNTGYEESENEEEEEILDTCNDYFRNLDPPIPSINDTDFPMLGAVRNKFNTFKIN